MKFKLNFLYRLHKETGVNFEISTGPDGMDFYFDINRQTRDYIEYYGTEDFEAGIKWLINKYLEVKK